MKVIYITGFMGAGKTTIGQALSKKMNVPVIDTDEWIVAQEQRSINEIFETDGEEHFRELETNALRTLPTENVIVTTGGGIILKKENRDYMKAHGITFFLYCEPDVVFERLKNDETRPLLAGDKKQEITTHFNERLSLYKKADYTVDTSSATIEEIVENILALLPA